MKKEKDVSSEDLLQELSFLRRKVAELEAANNSQKQGTETIPSNEEHFRSMIESASDLVYAINPEGIVTYIGPQVSRYGYTPDDIISKSMLEFIAPEDHERIMSDFINTMETGSEFPDEFRILDKGGNKHWVEDRGKVQRDRAGKITWMTGFLRDIDDRKKIEEELAIIKDLAQKTTQEVRIMLFSLRPVALETQGLVAALEQYADRLRQIEDFDVVVDPDGYDGQLSKMAESVVFGVIEEAVGNAKRHAQASQILIRLQMDHRQFTAEIRDDGRGFDVEALRKRGNLDLRRTEERAEIVGGRCLIQSQVGTGTVVLLEIPLQPESRI